MSIDKIAMYEEMSYLWECPGTGIGMCVGGVDVSSPLVP